MKIKIASHFFMALLLIVAFSCQNDDVVIDIPIIHLELSLPSDYIEVGKTDSLVLTIYPQDATNQNIIYSSSDPSIAEVDNDGVVKGITPGRATITAFCKGNEFTASHTVQVIRWTTYYSSTSVYVRPIAVDSEDNVWSGGERLTRFAQNMQEVSSKVRNVSAIAVNNGDRWFGTVDSGVWKYDGKSWTNLTKDANDEAFGPINYNAMMVDDKGNIWFDSKNGVTMFDGNQWQTFTSDDGLVYNNIMNMATDKDGVKWFATSKGVSSFDDEQWTSYTSESTGIGELDYVFSVAVDKENNKWFGSYYGALKFDGANWKHYNRTNSDIQWHTINAITVDKDNYIWFATEVGVIKFDGERWMHYLHVHPTGVNLHNVRAIDLDSKGNVWLGTTYGFVKLEM